MIKTLEQFDWNWPKKINRLQVQNLFRLQFIEDKANVIFLGGVGLGKTHLATALGYAACLQGHSVLFATAIDIINTLSAAQSAGRLKAELKKYTRPAVLIIDELGYLPIDKPGADLLFQVISQRYERGSLADHPNRASKTGPKSSTTTAPSPPPSSTASCTTPKPSSSKAKAIRMKDPIES